MVAAFLTFSTLLKGYIPGFASFLETLCKIWIFQLPFKVQIKVCPGFHDEYLNSFTLLGPIKKWIFPRNRERNADDKVRIQEI